MTTATRRAPTDAGTAAAAPARTAAAPAAAPAGVLSPGLCCLVLGLLDTAHLPEAVLLLLELLTAPLHLLGHTLADQPAAQE